MIWNRVDLAKVHRLFYPQVSVVIMVEANGHVGAMPAIWCMPLSFNPPLIGIALAPEHETCNMIRKTRAFTINWLDYSHARQVGELGEISGREFADKLAAVKLTTVKGKGNSQPLIQQASAVLECQVREERRTGTHELITGEIVEAYAADCFRDYWDFFKYNPLLYAGTEEKEGKSWRFMSIQGTTVRMPFKHEG
jgi:flavin reductase (DIM6/NTAB) family NADH-FMN oxidoreductase RutF